MFLQVHVIYMTHGEPGVVEVPNFGGKTLWQRDGNCIASVSTTDEELAEGTFRLKFSPDFIHGDFTGVDAEWLSDYEATFFIKDLNFTEALVQVRRTIICNA